MRRDDLLAMFARACGDPGAVVGHPLYHDGERERLIDWQARAVLHALDAAGAIAYSDPPSGVPLTGDALTPLDAVAEVLDGDRPIDDVARGRMARVIRRVQADVRDVREETHALWAGCYLDGCAEHGVTALCDLPTRTVDARPDGDPLTTTDGASTPGGPDRADDGPVDDAGRT